ncbi:alkaline shock response membrane anchor protein AmaP [Saccharothrix luteola]|uniref:alkaline shock response membrane anchor protein AmaP n=1 Tax=Saccharothrix luteola TaxID=2893018 RepID=UPI001E5EDCE5|nr:alkaline shock response membrane anchor protein AmaP [Saccharothrix luteola]MCC8249636.1 alkaline shock response membrane anchor protein AmaP [Saccharothrix luteola]
MNRSNRTERVMAAVLGALALLVGGTAVVLHRFAVDRPVLDPVVLDWARRHLLPVRLGLIALGLLAVVLGLRWAWRAVRPERHPDLLLDDVVVTAKALAAAVRADAEQVHGVAGAKVSVVGRPALRLRLRLRLRHGADVNRVWRELDGRVLSRARAALGVEVLPTAVRLDLAKRERQRVRKARIPGRMAAWRSR